MVGSISLMLSLSHLSKFPTFQGPGILTGFSSCSLSIPIFLQMLSGNAEAGQKKKPIFAIKLGFCMRFRFRWHSGKEFICHCRNAGDMG